MTLDNVRCTNAPHRSIFFFSNCDKLEIKKSLKRHSTTASLVYCIDPSRSDWEVFKCKN